MRNFYKLTLASLATFTLAHCGSITGNASNELVEEQLNANKTKKAILFVRQGDATVADSYQLSIVPSYQTLDNSKKGNAFIVDGGNTITPNSSSIDFSWLTSDTLVVSYDRRLRTFLTNTLVSGVTILYQSQ